MNSEPHSIDEIRHSLDTDFVNEKEFLSILKEHHEYLKESISVLMSQDASDLKKQKHLRRFFRLVEMHGKAEEETLYEHLKQNTEVEARLEGLGGRDEHDLAFQLEDELLDMGYETTWDEEIAAKAKVVAVLVKNHIADEESNMFPIAQKDLGENELKHLSDIYLRKCKNYLEESQETSIINRPSRTPSVSSWTSEGASWR